MANHPRVDGIEDTDRDIVVNHTVDPRDHVVHRHTHKRVQLLCPVEGLLQLETDLGAWMVPPGFGIWIPAGVAHRVRTINVRTSSLYFKPEALPQPPRICRVIAVSPLMRELVAAAMRVPILYEKASRDDMLMQLTLHEAARQPEVGLYLPMPPDPPLAALCQAFFKSPDQGASPAGWVARLHVSERTFHRRFRANTGMSFVAWRQRACVLVAMSRLSLGDSVTRIALDMGYESPSSFSFMFKKTMGVAPTQYGGAGRRRRGPGDALPSLPG